MQNNVLQRKNQLARENNVLQRKNNVLQWKNIRKQCFPLTITVTITITVCRVREGVRVPTREEGAEEGEKEKDETHTQYQSNQSIVIPYPTKPEEVMAEAEKICYAHDPRGSRKLHCQKRKLQLDGEERPAYPQVADAFDDLEKQSEEGAKLCRKSKT